MDAITGCFNWNDGDRNTKQLNNEYSGEKNQRHRHFHQRLKSQCASK